MLVLKFGGTSVADAQPISGRSITVLIDDTEVREAMQRLYREFLEEPPSVHIEADVVHGAAVAELS